MYRLIALLIVTVAATCAAAEPTQFTVTLKITASCQPS